MSDRAFASPVWVTEAFASCVYDRTLANPSFVTAASVNPGAVPLTTVMPL